MYVGPNIQKFGFFEFKNVEIVHVSLKRTKMDVLYVFSAEKSTFLKIRTHLYRKTFWRGIQKWPYFLILWAKNAPKVEKTWKWPFLKGYPTKNPILPPRGPLFQKNKVIFEILVKKYVDIGGSEFSKKWIFCSFLVVENCDDIRHWGYFWLSAHSVRTECAPSAHWVRTQCQNQTNLEIYSEDYSSFKLLVIMKEKLSCFRKLIWS